MQVNLVPALTTAGLAGQANELVLAVLSGLVGSHPQMQSLRELGAREDQRARQRREAAAGGPTEVTQQAERRLDTASRTWRRQQVRAEAREQVLARQRRVFRRVLTNARAQPAGEAAPSSAARKASTTPPAPRPPDDSPASRAARSATQADQAAPGNGGRHAGPAGSGAPASPAVQAGAVTGVAPGGGAAVRAGPTAPTVGAAPAVPDQGALAKVLASQTVRPVAEARPAGSALPADLRGPAKVRHPARQQAGRAARAQTADREANIERVLRTIHSRIGTRRSSAIVLFDPPELGSVRLRMDLRHDALTLRIDTQTHVAHRLLSEGLASLRQGLEAAGLHLERVEVRGPTAPPDGPGEQLPQQADTRGDERGASADAEQPEHQGGQARCDGAQDQSWYWDTEGAPGSMPPVPQGALSGRGRPAAESLVNVWA